LPLEKDDFKIIKKELGREPNTIEEELFTNLWSEHCAYRSSRPFLKKFVTDSESVVIGPGDDAGVIKLPTGDMFALGIESHNHPSYVDPYNGASTGIGGIVRDVLSMGGRPIALMDPLRFGNLDKEKNKFLFDGVVEGISDYGNSIGVPTVAGEVEFDESFNGNPLVNVFCIGKVNNLITGKAKDASNKLLLLGSSTGRDGLGGAAFASRELDESSEEDRPSVQVGDPFTQKVLIECVQEIVNKNLVESCRDLGAAGLGGASSEMCAQGNLGAVIDLNRVHTREKNMTGLEILLSESQERMLLEVKSKNVDKVIEISRKYDLEASTIGELTEDCRYVIRFEGEKVVDLPVTLIAEDAPVYERDWEAISDPGNIITIPNISIEDVLINLLSKPTIASKKWVYEQYDHDVQIRTVLGPGEADSSVLRLENGGIALTTGCNSKHIHSNPKSGSSGAVIKNVTNLATVGAEPIAMVDCLNFGSPENNEVLWQFKESVKGIADTSSELDIPIVGGNVSFYNESEEYGSTVKPTPNIGMVGWIESLDYIPPMEVEGGNSIYIAGETRNEMGGSQLFDEIGIDKGLAPQVTREITSNPLEICNIIKSESINWARSISRGGISVALSKLAIDINKGLNININNIPSQTTDVAVKLFSENYGRCLLVSEEELELSSKNIPISKIGVIEENDQLLIETHKKELLWELENLSDAYNSIEKRMRESG